MARIRTVKPEFWSHPVIGRLEDSVRLLALALLNLADDEGYFMADAAIVRSFAQPFSESSVSAQASLKTLCEVGWIEIKNHPSHGPVGRVVNFDKHQNINRPSISKIKTYFISESSVNTQCVVTEGSSLEQGTGNREINIPAVSPSRKKPQEAKPKTLGAYPDELNRAMEVWRDLGRELRSDEILSKFAPEQSKYLASIGTKGKAWEAWQKRTGTMTPHGIRVTNEHVLGAVKLWAETKYRQAKEGKKLAYPMLSSLINSPDFEDAVLGVVSQEVANAS